MFLEGVSSSQVPLTGQSAADLQQVQDNLNQFLNLLVTQLQNQDPLDPLDANEFTQQLVQFASVEQQIYQNANLETLIAVEKSGQAAAMVAYIGTTVEANGGVLPLHDSEATATYTLPADVAQTTIIIRDPYGNIMRTEAGETEAGLHTFTWDGYDDHGNPLADGAYSIEIGATTSDGTLLTIPTTVFARVSAVGSENGEVTLYSGDVTIPAAAVIGVRGAAPNTEAEEND
jgi:flagellar basal-body rod modification protein FlgD